LVPDKRTLTVLASLVAAMTVTSGLLLLLEPGPSAPAAGVALQSINRPDDTNPVQAQSKLFDTQALEVKWNAIVIHDSRTPEGSAQTMHLIHQNLGRDGLGYHFVLDNGPGSDDGKIEVGFRWSKQGPGDFFDPRTTEWPDTIGICLIGDGQGEGFTDTQLQQLVWLVQQLQSRYGIPKNSVYAQIGTQTAGSRFPDAWFRQQLRN